MRRSSSAATSSRAGRSRARRSSALRALGDRVLWLRGNADRELYPGEEGLAPPGALDTTREALSEEHIEFLHELPETQLVDDVLYCHASPRNDVDIFTERTPEERIAFLFDGLDVSTVVCGHTHTQYERRVEGIRLVNAGSVGMPYEEEPGAYWLLDLDHRRTPYEGAELRRRAKRRSQSSPNAACEGRRALRRPREPAGARGGAGRGRARGRGRHRARGRLHPRATARGDAATSPWAGRMGGVDPGEHGPAHRR